MICDDNYSSWYSLADNTEYSKNRKVRALHKSVCDIIKKLPHIKRKKSSYKYLIKQPKSQLKNIQTRSLRSVLKVNYNESLENSDFVEHEQDLQNVKRSTTKNDDTIIFQLPKSKKNTDLSEHVKGSWNRTSVRLQLKNVNAVMNQRNTEEINVKSSKVNQSCLENEDRVTVECDGQENTPNVNKLNPKLRTFENVRSSARLNGSKISTLSW